jgi:serine/threonine protein kinase
MVIFGADTVIAVDMWSAGVIMLFFLTKKFPIFQSSDDTEALMEVATIIGKKRMEKTATLHSQYDITLHFTRDPNMYFQVVRLLQMYLPSLSMVSLGRSS